MKTYDIWEMIDEDYESVAGKKIKLVKMPQYIEKVSIGDIASIGKNGNDIPCLFDDGGWRIKDLTGFEEWEEVKEPVNFVDVLRESNNKSIRFKLEHNLFIDHVSDRKFTLSVFLNYIGHEYISSDVADILLNGKFYIED